MDRNESKQEVALNAAICDRLLIDPRIVNMYLVTTSEFGDYLLAEVDKETADLTLLRWIDPDTVQPGKEPETPPQTAARILGIPLGLDLGANSQLCPIWMQGITTRVDDEALTAIHRPGWTSLQIMIVADCWDLEAVQGIKKCHNLTPANAFQPGFWPAIVLGARHYDPVAKSFPKQPGDSYAGLARRIAAITNTAGLALRGDGAESSQR